METVLGIMALLFVLCLALGAYATARAVGAAKRGVDRRLTQTRRKVEDSTLRAKSLVQSGPLGELAQLRLHLRTSMRATQDALRARVEEDESLRESLRLFERLSVHGHELDDELKRLETEPDRVALAARLPELRDRTKRITKSADSLRWAARDRAHRFAGDDLDSLSAQIDVEAGALRHWADDSGPAPRRQHHQRSGASGKGRPAGGHKDSPAKPAPSAGSEPAPMDSARPKQTRSERSATQGAGAQDAARPAITPPTRQPQYPWQKKPRPENTT